MTQIVPFISVAVDFCRKIALFFFFFSFSRLNRTLIISVTLFFLSIPFPFLASPRYPHADTHSARLSTDSKHTCLLALIDAVTTDAEKENQKPVSHTAESEGKQQKKQNKRELYLRACGRTHKSFFKTCI